MAEAPLRPSSHVLGDIGQKKAALIFTGWGWTADQIDSDYGEDLDCNIFVNQRRTAFHFRCQVKSSYANSNKYVKRLKNGDISVTIKVSLAKFWLTSYYPVLLLVYIDETEEIFWRDATQYLKENLNKLSKGTLTIHVSTKKILSDSKVDVEKSIQDSYAQLLRLSSPSIETTIIPVIMPGYKVLEPTNIFYSLNFREIASKLNLNIQPVGLLPEYLPAWTIALRSMDLSSFPCWKLKMMGVDIEKFDNKIIEFIRYISTENDFMLSSNQWLAFICKPIRILDKEINRFSNLVFNQEVTDWWSYCYFNDVKSDYSHAFDLLMPCLLPRKYHGFSWEFHHFIIPDKDLAVKFTGKIPTNPAYLAKKKLFRDFLLSQFLSWACPIDQVTLLSELLSHVNLQFSEIPDLCREEHKVGIICDYMFNPSLGLFTIPRTWKELEANSIVDRLEYDSLISKIPGTMDSSGVEDFILEFFRGTLSFSEYLQIEECDYIPGLPIDHYGRKISIQRYRVVKFFNEEKIKLNLTDCKTYLQSNLNFPEDVEITPYSFEDFGRTTFCVLSISWRPNLNESSLESLLRFIEIITQFFDKAIPESDLSEKSCRSTRGILEHYGTIIFEEASEDIE